MVKNTGMCLWADGKEAVKWEAWAAPGEQVEDQGQERVPEPVEGGLWPGGGTTSQGEERRCWGHQVYRTAVGYSLPPYGLLSPGVAGDEVLAKRAAYGGERSRESGMQWGDCGWVRGEGLGGRKEVDERKRAG